MPRGQLPQEGFIKQPHFAVTWSSVGLPPLAEVVCLQSRAGRRAGGRRGELWPSAHIPCTPWVMQPYSQSISSTMLCLMCDGGNSGEMPMLSSDRALPGRGWTSARCWGKASETAIHHLLEVQGIPASQEEEHWEDKLLRGWACIRSASDSSGLPMMPRTGVTGRF